ncbi:MAG: isocitrate lyase/PEP mutase family protein [Acidimicrobiales bacterium]
MADRAAVPVQPALRRPVGTCGDPPRASLGPVAPRRPRAFALSDCNWIGRARALGNRGCGVTTIRSSSHRIGGQVARAGQLRDRLSDGSCLIVPDAHDVMTAQLVEAADFPAVYVGSFGASASRWGVPDQSLVSLPQILESVAAIADHVDIPVVVDLEDGGPNALSVHHNVRAAERAGSAAIQIEDQRPGKMLGTGEELYPIEVAVERIRAAVEARTSPDTIIIGRSEALNVGGTLDETVDRCAAYAGAGADLVTPSMVPLEQITEVAARIGADATTWGFGTHGSEELNVEGHAMAIYAVQSTVVSYQAARDFLNRLATTGESLPQDEFMGLVGELLALQGGPANQQIAARFSTEP